MKIGIVGATGQVGGVMAEILAERDFPVTEMRMFASQRSAGTAIQWQGQSVTVEDADLADYSGLDIVLFSAGKTASLALAPRVVGAGAVVIDNSSGWRMDPEVPLVVAEVNPHALDELPKGIVANPNCTTMGAMPVLKPLDTEAGLRRVVVTTFQAASGAGLGGVDELAAQVEAAGGSSRSLTFDGSSVDLGAGENFGETLACNVVAKCGPVVDDGSLETEEEQKLRNEMRKILELPELLVGATCVRVPVFTGHSLSINAEFNNELSVQRAMELLGEAEGVVVDDLPTPMKSAGADPALVGRVRRDSTVEHGLAMFTSTDNLRKGAALNSVQVAELVAQR